MKQTIIIMCTILGLFSCNSSKTANNSAKKSSVADLYEKYKVIKLDTKTSFVKNATINFGENFTYMHGTTGCNSYGGKIEIKGDLLIIDDRFRVTKMYCQENMKDEGLFFRMLKKVKTFKVDKKVLSLLDKDGEEVLKAVKTK